MKTVKPSTALVLCDVLSQDTGLGLLLRPRALILVLALARACKEIDASIDDRDDITLEMEISSLSIDARRLVDRLGLVLQDFHLDRMYKGTPFLPHISEGKEDAYQPQLKSLRQHPVSLAEKDRCQVMCLFDRMCVWIDFIWL